MKVSKEALVACITAFQRYASLNHATLVQRRKERVNYWMKTLDNIPHLKVERVFPDPEKGEYFAQGWPRVYIVLDEDAVGLTAEEVAQALKDRNPAIYVGTRTGIKSEGVNGAIILNPHCLQEGEEVIVTEKLREILRV
jgi:L-seryl-tRNA(Ser) seleniumtransferase